MGGIFHKQQQKQQESDPKHSVAYPTSNHPEENDSFQSKTYKSTFLEAKERSIKQGTITCLKKQNK